MVSLPTDVLLSIFNYCTTLQLATLCSTCRQFHALIEEFGWQAHLRHHPRPTQSISFPSPKAQVQHNHICDLNWESKSFQARPLAKPWSLKQQPSMAMNTEFLLVGAGSSLTVYKFHRRKRSPSWPAVGKPASITMNDEDGPLIHRDDITSLSFQSNDVFLIGRQYGGIEVFNIHDLVRTELMREGTQDLHSGALVESISSSDDGSLSVALSSNGQATLFTHSGMSSINLESRSWTAHLNSSSSFVAVGSTSGRPLTVFPITPSGIAPQPSAILSRNTTATNSSSAVYAITNGPPCSPWGASPNVLASGWYDGYVRIHDLRTSATHLPVYSTHDPWCYEPVYSLSLGGGSGCHIGAGLARHSVVAFWDIRGKDGSGWSVYPPGNDPSPVYDLVMEGSRVWGVTERRAFVLDFMLGEERLEEGWPSLERVRGDNLKLTNRKAQFGSFYVTLYGHRTGSPMSRVGEEKPVQASKKW
ncbi:hypothetical protein DL96DRAFT_1533444 [Flagelloscypha sp. PMI_526]|nr:hypothetical protein DL96DRAFT_1533444 [Flagelloscypha sp. PMI_526]